MDSVNRIIKILSIDGGGIRGIIPAVVLAEIEKRADKPIYKMFDLIAGTSTGGIITLGLNVPNKIGTAKYSAVDLVKLYEKNGGFIFNRSLKQEIRSLRSLIEEKYSQNPLEELLEKYFEKTMISEALTNILVTAYEIERRVAFFFKSRHAKSKLGYDFLMKDAARATSAAPTYFEPAKLPTNDLAEYFALVDGGVFANNPAMCAYVEAKAMFPEATDFLLVSLGTGKLTDPIPYDQAKGWGLANWARPILDVVFDGMDDTVDYQLQQLLPESSGGKNYYRFQIKLREQNTELDNISEDNIRYLKLTGEEIIRNESSDINKLVQQLIV